MKELTEDVLRETIPLIDALRSGVLSDAEQSDITVRLDALLPDPHWFDYTIDQIPELPAEEVVRKAFQYRTIQL